KIEALEIRNVVRDHTEGERDRAALAEAVDPEARQPLGLVREIEVAALVEVAAPRRMRGRDRIEDDRGVEVRERLPALEPLEVPVAPDHGRLPNLQVDVARAARDGGEKGRVQIH